MFYVRATNTSTTMIKNEGKRVLRRRDTDSFLGVSDRQFLHNFKHYEHLILLKYFNTYFMKFKISPIIIVQFFRAQ